MSVNRNLQQWVNVAVNAAMRSPCRSKRGVVVVGPTGSLIATGHNDQPYPFKCDGSEACKKNCGKTAIHAEQAAILQALASTREIPQGTSMLHVKAQDGKACASMAPSCLECSKLILASGISWMHLLHHPSAQMLPGAKVVADVDGIDGPLQVRCYSAQHFHWLTAEHYHNIDLRILDGGMEELKNA